MLCISKCQHLKSLPEWFTSPVISFYLFFDNCDFCLPSELNMFTLVLTWPVISLFYFLSPWFPMQTPSSELARNSPITSKSCFISVPRKSTDSIKRNSSGRWESWEMWLLLVGERLDSSTLDVTAVLVRTSFWTKWSFPFSFPHELFDLKTDITQTGMPMKWLSKMGFQGILTKELLTLKTFENAIWETSTVDAS